MSSDLFEKNMAAFEQRLPHIHDALRGIGETISSIIWDGERAVNIDVDGVRLYLKDEPQWTAERRAASDDYQDSVIFTGIGHTNPSAITLPVVKTLHEFLIDRGAQALAAPVRDAGYCYIFGLGLGLQIRDMVKENRFHHYLIVEPTPEFIIHSFHVVDWEEIFVIAEENGALIDFVTASQPQAICAALTGYTLRHGNAFIEGSSFYAFYFSWALKNAYALFRKDINDIIYNMGFFEDEVTMVINSVKTLRHGRYRLINGDLSLELNHPVFIVGSGPSLDQDLPHLKRLKDKALIISCGTALGVLLKHGIKPDFHCENENVDVTADIIAALKTDHDLSGITLVATTSATEALAPHFDDVWYYFRGALTSSKLWGVDYQPLNGAAPLVANAAVSVAIRFGFKKIYLFGCDCGARSAERHHAAECFYNVNPKHEAAEETNSTWERWLKSSAPGNFGGEVTTAWHLEVSRQLLSQVMMAHPSVSGWNCSDGAFILGFQPKTAASIRLADLAVPKTAVIDRIGGKYPSFKAGEFFSDFDVAGLVKGMQDFQERFDTLIAGMREEGKDSFRGVEDAFNKLTLNDDGAIVHPEWEILMSCVRSIMRSANFLGARLVDDALYKEFVKFSLEVIGEEVLAIARQGEETYRQVVTLVEDAVRAAATA